jgi:arginine-tRNA-protein transferase
MIAGCRTMDSKLEIVELERYKSPPRSCSYLPRETAELEYRVIADLSPQAYDQLLKRGWRRFGREFFRPVCQNCRKCRSLRILVDRFRPSRSQRRTLARNAHIQVVVQPPTISAEHLRIFNAYHHDMQQRRGWRYWPISPGTYHETFVAGGQEFAREFLYFDDGRLVGVGLADLAPTGLSSVYFFHEPAWRALAPGVFSILQQWKFALENRLPYQYLGYWIAECQSMAYKANYRPHEILSRYPGDDESPVWLPGEA